MSSDSYVVPYAGQGSTYGIAELAAIERLLLAGAHLSGGVERDAFEREFATSVGASHAVSVTSCTVALDLSTRLLRLEPGDEVVVSTLTFQTTISALLGSPATVVFCDVDPNSLCLDPAALAGCVSRRTRAIFVTQYGGLIADLDAILDIAHGCGAMVVEDCAHAIGAWAGGHFAGVRGDIGCWSFQSLKNISTLGQGGMMTFRSADLAAAARRMRSMEPDARFVRRTVPPPFGVRPAGGRGRPVLHEKNAYTHDCVDVRWGGTNAIMSEPAAAVGRVQLRRLPEFQARRDEIAGVLDAAFRTVPALRVQEVPAATRHGHHLYTFFVRPGGPISRDALIARLADAGVEIVLRYFPLHLLPEWRLRGGRSGICPVAEDVWFNQLVNLPIYPTMTDRQVSYMIDLITSQIGTTDRQVLAVHRAGVGAGGSQ